MENKFSWTTQQDGGDVLTLASQIVKSGGVNPNPKVGGLRCKANLGGLRCKALSRVKL